MLRSRSRAGNQRLFLSAVAAAAIVHSMRPAAAHNPDSALPSAFRFVARVGGGGAPAISDGSGGHGRLMLEGEWMLLPGATSPFLGLATQLTAGSGPTFMQVGGTAGFSLPLLSFYANAGITAAVGGSDEHPFAQPRAFAHFRCGTDLTIGYEGVFLFFRPFGIEVHFADERRVRYEILGGFALGWSQQSG